MAREPQTKFFKSVKAISDHQLEILTGAGSIVIFDFGGRLYSDKWAALGDAELFNTAHTDGFYLLFGKDESPKVKISPSVMMDLVIIDRDSPRDGDIWDD